MNKLMIVLLAVCLVSTQAFVKRDAPPAGGDQNYLETVQKKFEDFSKDFNSKLGSAFDVDAVKKNLNEFAESINKAINDAKAKPAAA